MQEANIEHFNLCFCDLLPNSIPPFSSSSWLLTVVQKYGKRQIIHRGKIFPWKQNLKKLDQLDYSCLLHRTKLFPSQSLHTEITFLWAAFKIYFNLKSLWVIAWKTEQVCQQMQHCKFLYWMADLRQCCLSGPQLFDTLPQKTSKLCMGVSHSWWTICRRHLSYNNKRPLKSLE